MRRRLLPSVSNCDTTELRAPRPKLTMAMNAPTPIARPSVVSALRPGLAQRHLQRHAQRVAIRQAHARAPRCVRRTRSGRRACGSCDRRTRATSASCVTSTMVSPLSRAQLARAARAPLRRCACRARRSARRRATARGPFAQRARDRHALALAARELVRAVLERDRRGPTRSSSARALSLALLARDAGVVQRQRHVLEHGRLGRSGETPGTRSPCSAGAPRLARRASASRRRARRARSARASGRSRQPRMLSSVDLPEPLGPISATTSPARRACSRRAAPARSARPVRRPCAGRAPRSRSRRRASMLTSCRRATRSACPRPAPGAAARPRPRSPARSALPARGVDRGVHAVRDAGRRPRPLRARSARCCTRHTRERDAAGSASVGREAQRGLAHAQRVVGARDFHAHARAHARQQHAVRVVDQQRHRILHHARLALAVRCRCARRCAVNVLPGSACTITSALWPGAISAISVSLTGASTRIVVERLGDHEQRPALRADRGADAIGRVQHDARRQARRSRPGSARAARPRRFRRRACLSACAACDRARALVERGLRGGDVLLAGQALGLELSARARAARRAASSAVCAWPTRPPAASCAAFAPRTASSAARWSSVASSCPFCTVSRERTAIDVSRPSVGAGTSTRLRTSRLPVVSTSCMIVRCATASVRYSAPRRLGPRVIRARAGREPPPAARTTPRAACRARLASSGICSRSSARSGPARSPLPLYTDPVRVAASWARLAGSAGLSARLRPARFAPDAARRRRGRSAVARAPRS